MRYLFALMVLASILLVACGGGTADSSPERNTSSQAQAGKTTVQNSGSIPKTCELHGQSVDSGQAAALQKIAKSSQGEVHLICAELVQSEGDFARVKVQLSIQTTVDNAKVGQTTVDLQKEAAGWTSHSIFAFYATSLEPTDEQRAVATQTAVADQVARANQIATAQAQEVSDSHGGSHVLSGLSYSANPDPNSPFLINFTVTDKGLADPEFQIDVDVSDGGTEKVFRGVNICGHENAIMGMQTLANNAPYGFSVCPQMTGISSSAKPVKARLVFKDSGQEFDGPWVSFSGATEPQTSSTEGCKILRLVESVEYPLDHRSLIVHLGSASEGTRQDLVSFFMENREKLAITAVGVPQPDELILDLDSSKLTGVDDYAKSLLANLTMPCP